MPRSIWKGVISFGMVSIPVRLYSATESKDVSFHLLHKTDHSRIRFKRWCLADDHEVEQDELVRAFEVSKEQYVEITDEDLEQLPLPSKHTIELSAFVDARDIDPIYFEKTYYLEPEETGVKPYALLVRVLKEKKTTGLAKITLRNKEHLCALRPVEDAVVLETLYYPDEIRENPTSLPRVSVTDRELTIAASLVDALSESFDPSRYRDEYRDALLEMIKNKAEGREVVGTPEAPATEKVGDLMAALRASVEAARKRKSPEAPAPGQARAARKESGHAKKASGTSTSRKKPSKSAT